MDGKGGLKGSARWHTRGRRIIYTSQTPAGALLEVLVHLRVEPDELPEGYRLLSIDIPGRLKPRNVRMPKGWEHDIAQSRAKGDAWLSGGKSALLRVPSAIVPAAYNILLNPEHPDAAGFTVLDDSPFRFDRRLLPSSK